MSETVYIETSILGYLNQSVLDLAEQFLRRSNLPAKADVDAVHIAVATVHESGREVVSLSRKPGLKTRWSGQAKDIGSDTVAPSRRST